MSGPSDPARQRVNGNGIDAHSDEPEPNGSDGYESDPHDDVEELESEEFPSYFTERDGRLFPSSSSPYPLPVDTPEQQRLTLSHNLLLQFFGANYIGPVANVLRESEQRKMALDICTGNGKWVMDMAQEYPRVHFTGFDIVPIATRYPLRNVQFEVDDVNTHFRWSDMTFDMVHARTIVLAVRDYLQVLQEVSRILRPGGLFVSYEWAPYPAFDPSLQRDPAMHAPASCRFHDAVNLALLQSRGLQPIAAQIPSFLESAGVFTEISPAQHYIPIGSWPTDPSMRSIGATCLEANERYADSVKALLIESGWTEVEVDNMVTDFIQEIRTSPGLVSILYTVHARRA